jgi:hypothetical protein
MGYMFKPPRWSSSGLMDCVDEMMADFECIYFLTAIFLMSVHGISWLVMFSRFIVGLCCGGYGGNTTAPDVPKQTSIAQVNNNPNNKPGKHH